MMKHPEDRYQRRIIREKKAIPKTVASKVRRRYKETLQDQETKDEFERVRQNANLDDPDGDIKGLSSSSRHGLP